MTKIFYSRLTNHVALKLTIGFEDYEGQVLSERSFVRYFLDFRFGDDQVMRAGETGGIAVNIWSFLSTSRKESREDFVQFIRSEILPNLAIEDIVARHGSELRNSLREFRGKGNAFSILELISCRDLLAAWISTLWSDSFQHENWTSDFRRNAEFVDFSPSLSVRTGIVELRVVEQHFINKAMSNLELAKIAKRNHENEFMISEPTSMKLHLLDSGDVNWNIRMLMTNAGFYPTLKRRDSTLDSWVDRYSEGMSLANGIFRTPGCDFYEITVENEVLDPGGLFNYLDFPDRTRFHQMLKDHSILFVTPFSQEIDEIYMNGNIFHLWKDYDLPNFNLKTIQAPMSIYPNRPDKSWTDSFNKLCREIDKQFASENFSLFFISAGSYGIPISSYVFQKYGVSSNTLGNLTNFYFGVRQNASESESPELRNWERWAKSSLANISGLGRVDDGRYVLNE